MRPSPPPSKLLRHGVIAGALLATSSSIVSAIAYLQARIAISGPRVVPPSLDAQLQADNAEAVWCRIVWLGDSLAAGLGAVSPELSLPHLVATGRGHHTRLHVYAVPGATSADVIRYQLPALRQLRHGLAQVGQRIDAVGVTVGANDIPAFTPRHRFRRNVERIVVSASGDHNGTPVPIVLVSIPQLSHAIRLPRPLRSFASARALWLDLALRRIARHRANVYYVSVRNRPSWVRRRDIRNFLAADLFHPSGAGYAIWASRVAEAFDIALAPAPAP